MEGGRKKRETYEIVNRKNSLTFNGILQQQKQKNDMFLKGQFGSSYQHVKLSYHLIDESIATKLFSSNISMHLQRCI